MRLRKQEPFPGLSQRTLLEQSFLAIRQLRLAETEAAPNGNGT
jgi:hypothetical protein